MMHAARRLSLLVTAGTLGGVALIGAIEGGPGKPPLADAPRALGRATAYYDSTIVLARNARPRGDRGDELALSLGYLERMRLGLGSPFRLMDEALNDPRLDSVTATRVAWALLGRLERGEAYVVDPVVLDGFGPWDAERRGATGAQHLALIENAIGSAADPREGELAVRLAYTLAAAKGTVSSSSTAIAAQVAALLRDRELARADLQDLLRDAAERQTSVLELAQRRRVAKMLRVERPSLAALPPEEQVVAIRQAGGLARALDTLQSTTALSTTGTEAWAPVLGNAFAARLGALGALRPPVPQIAVTLASREQTAIRAANDETLAALYARAPTPSDSVRRANALALLSASVAVRSLAQAVPWFPGDPGPSVADLAAEFGLDDVSFARGVPESWRPYYLRDLGDALRDLQSVLPAFSVEGLRVRFASGSLRDSALAMHDPRTRTLQLAIGTSGGTLAHELSHDLDWQMARSFYSAGSSERGGYGTDRAARDRRGPLASSVRGLAEARLLRPIAASAPVPGPVGRPAELFARSADWFIASALAAEGRSNGFLSLVQDGLLTGYAAGPPAAVGVAGAGSLVSALEQMTYVPDSVRAAFDAQWADPASVDPVLLVRRVLDTPVSWRALWGGGGRPGTGAGETNANDWFAPVLCTAAEAAPPAESARQSILMLAIDARAQRLAARRARFRGAPGRAGFERLTGPVDSAWMAAQTATLRRAAESAIVAELTTSLADQGVLPVVPATFRSSAANCSAIAR